MFKKFIFFEKIFEELKKKIKINVDLHMHTSWTDGKNTAAEMYEASCKKNMDAIFFSEHTRKSSANWFSDFLKDVKSIKKKSCMILAGTEVKILNNHGEIDLSEKIKKKSDLVMASVHRFPGEVGDIKKNTLKFDKEEAIDIEYKLSMGALDNSSVDILGHCFGMSLKRFGATPSIIKFKEIIKKCSKKNKIFEINSRYHHNCNELLQICLKNNCLISLGSNAHSIDEIGEIQKKLYR